MRGIKKKIKNMKISVKLILMFMGILFLYTGINTARNIYITYNQGKENVKIFEKNMVDREKRRVYNLLDLVSGYINSYNKVTAKNRREVFNYIEKMRYGKNKSGYFWINDTKEPYPTMLLHPFKKLVGKVMNSKKFENRVLGSLGGKKRHLFTGILNAVKNERHEGYLEYMWPKPGEKRLQRKLSFMRYFKNFNFIVGTGFYIDDIYKSINKMQAKIDEKIFDILIFNILVGIIILLISGGIIFLGTKSILIKPLDNLLHGLKKVQYGDNNVHIDILSHDEIGYVTQSFNKMVKKIRVSEKQLKRYAGNLEKKVESRTIELSKTLKDIRLIKENQDGDYFLTSLIQKPLSPNNARSENIKIDFVIDQYKKFKFRKWESDIGGDLCITDNIELNSSKYAVFINGDAMGKSLQGAGGALVLGAAFQSVLERSKSIDIRKQSPERWLKNAFQEMHAIFESFDGSMLMSVVIGLLEEKTGLLYFINAEHPYTVLYREGKSRFIEEDSIFRKLGSAITTGGFSVKTFQLKHEDVIFIGSDGRDDILIGHEEDGSRVINEDETLFLKTVEKANGDLEKIKEITESNGKLIDDYSLMRIQYFNPENMKDIDPLLINYLNLAKEERKRNNISKAIEILEDVSQEECLYPIVYKELFRNYLSDKNYKKAVFYGEKYCIQKPYDTQSMYALSVAFKLAKDYDKSIDFGERVRLRETDMVENLINLSDAYYRKYKYEKASNNLLDLSKKFLEKAKKIDSNNEKIDFLYKKIELKIS